MRNAGKCNHPGTVPRLFHPQIQTQEKEKKSGSFWVSWIIADRNYSLSSGPEECHACIILGILMLFRIHFTKGPLLFYRLNA